VVNVSRATLASYVAFYRFGPGSVMTVKLEGSQLSAQLTGQRFIPVYPSSNVAFFTKVVDAHLNFVVDGQGRSTAMVFYENGREIVAPGIDAATAQGIQSALDARVALTPQGWNKYLVRHANGTEEVGFVIDVDGTIMGAFRRP
jgi:hypothetical protein